MSVSLVLIVVMAVLFACGVYAMLERSLTRVLIGFLLLGNAANLLLLIVMGQPKIAPFYDGGTTDAADMSDALPQALALTAIVITFGISAFLLALIYRSWQLGQADTVIDDADDVALAERIIIAPALAHREIAHLPVEDRDCHRGILDQQPQPLLARVQGVLGDAAGTASKLTFLKRQPVVPADLRTRRSPRCRHGVGY